MKFRLMAAETLKNDSASANLSRHDAPTCRNPLA
jgi:hypothetical protein